MLQAMQIGVRTSQEEKRRALRNAILNAALPSAPEQSVQQMFLSYIDTFTVWHLRLLDLFDDPVLWARRNQRQHPEVSIGGARSMLIERHFPELHDRREFTDQVWRDLYLRGLVNTEKFQVALLLILINIRDALASIASDLRQIMTTVDNWDPIQQEQWGVHLERIATALERPPSSERPSAIDRLREIGGSDATSWWSDPSKHSTRDSLLGGCRTLMRARLTRKAR